MADAFLAHRPPADPIRFVTFNLMNNIDDHSLLINVAMWVLAVVEWGAGRD